MSDDAHHDADRLLATAIATAVGRTARVTDRRRGPSSSFAATWILTLDTGRRLFVKETSQELPGLFRSEAAGLAALAAAIRTVAPLALAEDDTRQLLVLELIESAPPTDTFWERFGQSLATLHRRCTAERFGFHEDNFIGASVQQNGWLDRWPAFFAQRRLGFQLARAVERGLADRTLRAGIESIMRKIDSLLEPAPVPSLLHGDLWSGNYLVDGQGEAVLIDPAVSYGSRETDLAMTELFGGFDRRFADAYREAWPLESGYAQRRDLLNLYHLLNHLNLFGPSYLAQVRAVVDSYR